MYQYLLIQNIHHLCILISRIYIYIYIFAVGKCWLIISEFLKNDDAKHVFMEGTVEHIKKSGLFDKIRKKCNATFTSQVTNLSIY